MTQILTKVRIVMLELLESCWYVIGDTSGVSHNNSIKFIDFDTPGSSLSINNIKRIIILDTKCVIFDTLSRFI